MPYCSWNRFWTSGLLSFSMFSQENLISILFILVSDISRMLREMLSSIHWQTRLACQNEIYLTPPPRQIKSHLSVKFILLKQGSRYFSRHVNIDIREHGISFILTITWLASTIIKIKNKYQIFSFVLITQRITIHPWTRHRRKNLYVYCFNWMDDCSK